jgi:hypothetical protein
MKRRLLLLIALFATSTVNAQKITHEFKDVSMSEALKEIEASTDKYTINFIYNELEDFTVTSTVKNKSVAEAIQQIIGFYPIKMTVDGDNIFVECVQKETHKFSGKIVDNNGNPIMYANIALLSSPDSAFITGGVSNEAGQFVIPCNAESVLTKISCVGYKTKVMHVDGKSDLGIVCLLQENYKLAEVTVRAKMIQQTTDGILINVSGTDLGKLGYAPDVLKHLPFVILKNDAYEVIGKGAPLIYVDNRLIRDNNDLKQINSADIKQVKVITNPGAEYDASVNAVIRITTVKIAGNRWSGMVDGNLSAERKISHDAGASLNFRTGGLDIFGSLRYMLNNSKENQKATTIYNNRKEDETTLLRNHYLAKIATLGLNDQFNDKLSAGTYYKYYDYPNTKFDCYADVTAYKNGVCNNQLNTIDNRRYKENSHSVNAYCDYQISKDTYLKLDADYLNHTQIDKQYFSDEDGNLSSRNKSKSQLYSGRLIFAASLCGGQIKTGGEVSYTDNNNRYNLLDGATLATPLTSTANEARQNLYAGFAEYSHTLGERLSATAGVRYEYTNFNYYINGNKSAEASKTYNGFYPSASVAYKLENLQMSLAYRYSTQRPNYFSLRNAVAINSPYSYEGGNPELQPQKKNMITYSLQWKDLQLMASYSMIKDASMFMMDMYNHSDSITFSQFKNVDRYRVLNISLVYSPTLFKIWSPQLTVELEKQYLTYHSAKYNKPYLYINFQSMVKLPHSFILGCDMEYFSKSNQKLVHEYTDFYASAYCVKTFFHDRLRLNLKVTNLFNTSRERWSLNQNGVYFDKWNDGGRRTLKLTVTYRFNQTKSKYKGEASTDELKRL